MYQNMPLQRPLSGLGIEMEPPGGWSRPLTRPTSMVELDSRASAFAHPNTRPQSLINSKRKYNSNMRSAECGAAGVFIDNDSAAVLPGQPLNTSAFTSTNPASDASLFRQGTLLSMEAPSSRKAKELDRILSKNVASAQSPTGQRAPIKLEQAKGNKARVDVDLTLDSAIVVEGGVLKGKLHVMVNSSKNDSFFKITCPKVRLAGFEEISSDGRYIFYHYASMIDCILEGTNKKSLPCFEVEQDSDGFHRARHGHHSISFEIRLPIGRGAKGPFKSKQGTVRYIVVGSIKIRSSDDTDKAISHFYRHIDVHPYFNPAIVLATAPQPISRSTEKSVFMGGSGKVLLSAKLHRNTWVAGQHCYVDVYVRNESSKKVKSLSFSVVRSAIVYRPRPILDTNSTVPNQDEDHDACQTSTTKKKVAEETVDVGKKASKVRGVTAKGMWMGVESGEQASFSHSIAIPQDALSISRGRLLEVTYILKVSVNTALSSDVSVDLPLQIINFISIDPPPGHAAVDVLTPGIAAILNDPKSSAKLSHLQSWSVDSLRRKISSALTSPPPTGADVIKKHENQHKYVYSPPSSSPTSPPRESGQKNVLRHQRSIDSIGSAIASATARRMRHKSAVCDLSIKEEEDCSVIASDGFLSPLEKLQKSLEDAHSYLNDDDYKDDDNSIGFDDMGEESEDELNLVVQYSKNNADDQGRVSPSSWTSLQKKNSSMNSISHSFSSSFRSRTASSPTVIALSKNSSSLNRSSTTVFRGNSTSLSSSPPPSTKGKFSSGFIANLPKPKSKSRTRARVSSMPVIAHAEMDPTRIDEALGSSGFGIPPDPPRPRPTRPLPQIPTYPNNSLVGGNTSSVAENSVPAPFPNMKISDDNEVLQDIAAVRTTSTSTTASSSSAPSSVLATPLMSSESEQRHVTFSSDNTNGKHRESYFGRQASPPLSKDIVNIEDDGRKGIVSNKLNFANTHQMQRQLQQQKQQQQQQQHHHHPHHPQHPQQQQYPHQPPQNHQYQYQYYQYPNHPQPQISPDPIGIQQIHYYGGRTHAAPPPFRMRAISNNLYYNYQNYQHFSSPRSEMSTDDYPAINNLLGRQASLSSFKAPMLRQERLRQSGLK